MHIPFSKTWGWVGKGVLECFASNPFFSFWGEKSLFQLPAPVAHWSVCHTNKRSPGRTGQPGEGQALRSVLFVSTTPRGRCVQCHQLAGDEINILAASLSTGMQLCFFGSKLKGRRFSKHSPPVVSLQCMGCSLLEGLEFQPPTLRAQWHKNPPMLAGWSCNQLYLRVVVQSWVHLTSFSLWDGIFIHWPQTRLCSRAANAGKQLLGSK